MVSLYNKKCNFLRSLSVIGGSGKKEGKGGLGARFGWFGGDEFPDSVDVIHNVACGIE
jgi:hypothetical protein